MENILLHIGIWRLIPARDIMRNGLTENELPDIVTRWRRANPAIVQFWYDVERTAWNAVTAGASTTVGKITIGRECDPANELDFMTVTLPCGRKLYYAKPHVGKNRFGRDSICYYGMNQTSKQWRVVVGKYFKKD